MKTKTFIASLGLCITVAISVVPGDIPKGVKDSQNPKDKPPSPEKAVRMFDPPDGFNVTLFAGEPHISQPIAMTFDDRGRLWVAECYSYPDWKGTPRDRIVILQDTNNDGKFDTRKVFLDGIRNLTGLALGHGGVWICSAPELLFIPDRDRDDRPDGKAEVVLDGWTLEARHNIYNGLLWGPDGWLYGRHGITAESQVGRPNTPPEKRTKIRCGIWRYHPIKKTFEVVVHGTTNPWGMDFNDVGEAFFSNSVIEHCWHVIPGARYQRMYGSDYNPYAYELMPSTSDHLHWGGGHWTTSRDGKGVHSEAGGGHAHAGFMIYLGDNWPKEYRHHLFFCNIHGNRLNRDVAEREGSAYVVKHRPDFMRSDNKWFRGIAMLYGPSGAVYVSDWSDLGECHDHDGVHRTSGRIYRIAFGKTKSLPTFDLAKKSNEELIELQKHQNDWYVRHARRILAERAENGPTIQLGHVLQLLNIFQDAKSVREKLRAMWCLYVINRANDDWLVARLADDNEHVRSWAIRLLGDARIPSRKVQKKFAAMAKSDPSSFVRLYLASALQRLPIEHRMNLAAALLSHKEDADDRFLPLLIWYGVEPAVAANPERASELVVRCEIPKVRRFIARRLAETTVDDPNVIGLLLGAVTKSADNSKVQQDILDGMWSGLKGHKTLPRPSDWTKLYNKLLKNQSDDVRLTAHLLGLLFEDASAQKALVELVRNAKAESDIRESALRGLMKRRPKQWAPMLFDLLEDDTFRGAAIHALARFDHEKTPRAILKLYPKLSPDEKDIALQTLASRPSYAFALLNAMESKTVPPQSVSAFTIRQLRDLGDKKINTRIEKVWGPIRYASKENKALIKKYQKSLTDDVLAKADMTHGRTLYRKICGQCHRLFGEGKTIGPDLTGANRNDLFYLLENVLDPNAVIGREYQLTNILTKQGRLASGIILEETPLAVTLQSATEKLVIPKNDVDRRQESRVSMMPEGMLSNLSETEIRDLIGYISRAKGER